MRPGEALALDRQDVDLRHGVVHVRAGKQKKQREVPLHHSTITRACASTPACATLASPSPQRRRSSSAARGRRMGRAGAQPDVHQAGPRGRPGRPRRSRQTPPARSPPCLCRAHAAGLVSGRRGHRPADAAAVRILGHVDPASTYWYLEAVPELLELISRRLEQLPRGALMTALAPALQAYLHRASDHPAQLQPANDRRLPRHVQAAARASRTSRPASSHSSWTSTISTRR